MRSALFHRNTHSPHYLDRPFYGALLVFAGNGLAGSDYLVEG